MLFYVSLQDAADKNTASYIVKANSPEDALAEVALAEADLAELNQPYINQPFPRYKVWVEEIDLETKTFYQL